MLSIQDYEYPTELERSLHNANWDKCGLSGVLWGHPSNPNQKYPFHQALVEQFNKMGVPVPTKTEDIIIALNEYAFNFVNVDIRCIKALQDIDEIVNAINQPNVTRKITDIIHNTLPRIEV